MHLLSDQTAHGIHAQKVYGAGAAESLSYEADLYQ